METPERGVFLSCQAASFRKQGTGQNALENGSIQFWPGRWGSASGGAEHPSRVPGPKRSPAVQTFAVSRETDIQRNGFALYWKPHSAERMLPRCRLRRHRLSRAQPPGVVSGRSSDTSPDNFQHIWPQMDQDRTPPAQMDFCIGTRPSCTANHLDPFPRQRNKRQGNTGLPGPLFQ